jgi:adenine-specific DNA methylase
VPTSDAVPDLTKPWTSDLRERKAKGVYYTPPAVARFMANWAIRDPDDTVLEPSAGGGVFVQAALERLQSLGATHAGRQILAVEVSEAAAEAVTRLEPEVRVLTRDFLDLAPDDPPSRSAVLGNPPYIRHHLLAQADRARGLKRASELGIELSGLASSWAHFVLHASSFLDPESGRLALVLPSELLTSDYADTIRRFLEAKFAAVRVITFRRPIFEEAQVDAVLLLAEKGSGPTTASIEEYADEEHLSMGPRERFPLPVDARWRIALDAASQRTYVGLASSKAWARLGDLARIRIGLVTGANRFFIMDDAARVKRRLPVEMFIPILERPRQLAGLAATRSDARLLLVARGPKIGLPDEVRSYVEVGEAAHYDERFKCSIRDPWYALDIPTARPDLLLPYMSHGQPRLVVNRDRLLATNLIHGLELKEKVDPEALSVAALSSASAFSAEREGRTYGGGVFKLEPSEASRLLVPRLSPAKVNRLKAKWNDVDALVRGDRIEEARGFVDELLGFRDAAFAESLNWFRDRRAALARPSRRRPFAASAREGEGAPTEL